MIPRKHCMVTCWMTPAQSSVWWGKRRKMGDWCSCVPVQVKNAMICSFFHQVRLINYSAFLGYTLQVNINCVIAVEFGISFCGGKLLVAGAILVSSESCQTSAFLFYVQRIFLPASLSSSFWSKSDIQLKTLHLKVDDKKDESKVFRAVLLTHQNITYANYIIKKIKRQMPYLRSCLF